MTTDFERLSELYDIAHDETKPAEQLQKAQELLVAIDTEQLVQEYISLPDNRWSYNGRPGTAFGFVKEGEQMYQDVSGVWARLCLEHGIQVPREGDVLGTIVTHWKYLGSKKRTSIGCAEA